MPNYLKSNPAMLEMSITEQNENSRSVFCAQHGGCLQRGLLEPCISPSWVGQGPHWGPSEEATASYYFTCWAASGTSPSPMQ